MTLDQFHSLKVWHSGHPRPMEKNVWDAVLTLWMLGWVGIPTTLLLGQPMLVFACIGAILAPSVYVAFRQHLHRAGRLRCDWITALR